MGALLSSRGLATVRDLLFFFPRAYEDRSRLSELGATSEGQEVTLELEIVSRRKIPMRGRLLFEVMCRQGTEYLRLKWFHALRGMEDRFKPGTKIWVHGTIKHFMGQPEIIHPEVIWKREAGSSTEGDFNIGRLIPVYTELETIPTRTLRKILWHAIETYADSITEDLPERFLKKHQLPRIGDAVRTIHFPPATEGPIVEDLMAFQSPAHQRLIYEEFFKFEFLVLQRRMRTEKEAAPPLDLKKSEKTLQTFKELLPFQLTRGQEVALKEILEDLALPHPMNRLIQGDVGSGKTAVAFLSAACILANGAQAALMAPTEILADQHFRNAQKLFHGKLNCAILTGKTPTRERVVLLERLKNREPLLLIGTHALLEDPVQFANLQYVMVDEQQRFGVDQRRTLHEKGTREEQSKKIHPHSLVLTATPIPRTLALTAYGDLHVSSIRELPPGRSPIQTHVVREKWVSRAYQKMREELKSGRQAYFIYPLVSESEAEGFTELKSAIREAERIQREVFPDFKVGLLHGQMKADEKAKVMQDFQAAKIHVLVSTTVVEVGVDVPNATIMAIEHAERFGLSQLHQLRGRVGRGAHASTCFLFPSPRIGETATERLSVLEKTQDGFEIAEADLKIRGPGEFLGTRQSGALPFKMADLVRDQDWLLKAREDAKSLLEKDPTLTHTETTPLREYFIREGQWISDLIKIS